MHTTKKERGNEQTKKKGNAENGEREKNNEDNTHQIKRYIE